MSPIVTQWFARFCVLLVVAAFAGCIDPPRRAIVVSDPDPTVKIPAIKNATRDADRSAIPQLVRDLSSDDSAVRFYASKSLRDLTGKTFGYRYYDDEIHREEAVQRWKKWLKTHKSTSPATPDTRPTTAETPAR